MRKIIRARGSGVQFKIRGSKKATLRSRWDSALLVVVLLRQGAVPQLASIFEVTFWVWTSNALHIKCSGWAAGDSPL